MKNELIRLIALDLDGTFLNKNGEIHFENLKVIEKIREERSYIKIVFATGTGPERAIKYAKECQIDKQDGCYIICYNGGAIINITDEKIKVETKKTLSVKQCQDIVNIAEHYNAELQIYNLEHKRILGLENIKSFYQEKIKAKQENINNQDFLYKGLLIFKDDDKKINNIMNQLKEEYSEFKISRSKLSKSHPYYQVNPNGVGIEINLSGADKGQALEIICKKLNIKPEQVLACGDELNDETMLEFVGYSIAMGNACPKIKEIARFHTDTNENAGVAKAVEEHIFSQEQIAIWKFFILETEFQILMDNWEEFNAYYQTDNLVIDLNCAKKIQEQQHDFSLN